MKARMQVQRIGLSERWTRIANILPSSIYASSNHPNLFVDPSGFRRVVTRSLSTCNVFLAALKTIEDGLEKRIPGITSYYVAVEAPKTSDISFRGGGVCVSGSSYTIASQGSIYGGPAYTSSISLDSHEPEPAPQQQQDLRAVDSSIDMNIFERLGGTTLYNNRRLDTTEEISFKRALSVLKKVASLRNTTLDCLTTFGALDEVLEVGKVFSKKTHSQMAYYGEHAVLEQNEVEEDKIALSQYWNTLACVSRIKAIYAELASQLVEI